MIGATSFPTRRSFLSSLMTAAFFSHDLLGQIAGLNFFRDSPETRLSQGAIEFASSDTKLVEGFRWAKAQALAYVRDSPVIGTWYEAALPGRNAFCMRDVSHMSTGAQFLGLGPNTRNMLHQFAQHISASKKWCTWWEITGEGKPAPVDYKSDDNFWYCLPANFDVLDACYRQWLWSRDNAYLDDVFLNYYRHTVTDYVKQWDHNNDGLLEHLPGDGHMGIATYDEDLTDDVLVGADLIAAQYAAYGSYAAFQRARNDQAVANEFAAKAQDLKSLYNNKWWDASRNCYFAALSEDGQFHADMKASTGGTDIQFPLYFGLTDSGAKTQASLDQLEKRLRLDSATLGGHCRRSRRQNLPSRHLLQVWPLRVWVRSIGGANEPRPETPRVSGSILLGHRKPGRRVDGHSSVFPARGDRDLSSTDCRNRMGCPAPRTRRPQCYLRKAHARWGQRLFQTNRDQRSFGGQACPGIRRRSLWTAAEFLPRVRHVLEESLKAFMLFTSGPVKLA